LVALGFSEQGAASLRSGTADYLIVALDPIEAETRRLAKEQRAQRTQEKRNQRQMSPKNIREKTQQRIEMEEQHRRRFEDGLIDFGGDEVCKRDDI